MTGAPSLSIVVPVRDSARNLSRLLDSLQSSTSLDFEVIVNDDARSTDDTSSMVDRFVSSGMQITYLVENTSMAQARKRGAEAARGRVLLHLDSDMQVSPGLVGECIRMTANGIDAMVIPEQSFGENFWAEVRALEKRCYDGVESIEGLRCVTAECYWQVGGHNPELVFSEDKDLDIRVRDSGARVGRTTSFLRHDEGRPTLRGIARKKQGYLATAELFAAEHPEAFGDQTSVVARVKVLLKSAHLGLRHPLRYIGIFLIGGAELYALFAFKARTPRRRVTPARRSKLTSL